MSRSYHVSGSSLIPSPESDESVRDDPRGFLHMWEEPIRQAKYIMGCDPTVGITGWSRASKTSEDFKTDNCAIEVWRVDGARYQPIDRETKKPAIDPVTKQPVWIYQDVQAAEYAAPIDAVEAARVCNLLGRIYAGDSEDQCELIYEAYPGPGMLTTQELLRLGYTNLWYWEYIDSLVEQTSRVGWRSSRESQKLLWYRSRRHILEDRALIKSPWLLEEYGNAVTDPDTMRAKAAYGFHDDRMQAANMCFWAGHKWTYDVERASEVVSERPDIDWQHRAPVIGDAPSYKDAWAGVIDSWDY